MDEVQLSKNEFKALSSETRNQILKMLRERNFTLSELSRKTSLSAPTVKQHLNVLLDSGLIELNDEGRKWKYYSLSPKGRKIAVQGQTQFLIVLALSSLALVSLLLIMYASISVVPMAGVSQDSTVPLGGSPVKTLAPAETPDFEQSEVDRLFDYAGGALDCQAECGDCNAAIMECTAECEECFIEYTR